MSKKLPSTASARPEEVSKELKCTKEEINKKLPSTLPVKPKKFLKEFNLRTVIGSPVIYPEAYKHAAETPVQKEPEPLKKVYLDVLKDFRCIGDITLNAHVAKEI